MRWPSRSAAGQLVDQLLGQVAGWAARPLGQGHRPVDLVVGPVGAADDGVGAPEALVQGGQRVKVQYVTQADSADAAAHDVRKARTRKARKSRKG